MFSKAVPTFLAIGALWLNVSAAPIPPIMLSDSPPGTQLLNSRSDAQLINSRPGTQLFHELFQNSGLSADAHSHSARPESEPPRPESGVLPNSETWYGHEYEDPAPQPKRKSSLLMWGGELPRSFSALSYRHLTFVFSVAGGTVATTVGAGIGVGILEHKNHTRREFELESEGSNSVPSLLVLKREPMPEDEASDSLSSPLEHDPEPAPPSL